MSGGGIDPRALPSGMEVSPDTVDAEKMALCREAGIDRVSMGIQSFGDAEVRALVRPQQRDEVERARGQVEGRVRPGAPADRHLRSSGDGPGPTARIEREEIRDLGERCTTSEGPHAAGPRVARSEPRRVDLDAPLHR